MQAQSLPLSFDHRQGPMRGEERSPPSIIRLLHCHVAWPAGASTTSKNTPVSSSPALMYSRSAFLPAWVMAELSLEAMVAAFGKLSLEDRLKVLRSLDAKDRGTPDASTPGKAADASGQAASSGSGQAPAPTSLDPIGENIASEDYGEPTLSAPASESPPAAAPAAQPAASGRPQKEPEVKTPPARKTPALAPEGPSAAKAHPPPLPSPAAPPPTPTAPANKAIPKNPPAAKPSTADSSKAPPPQIISDDPVPATPAAASAQAASPAPAATQPDTTPASQPGSSDRAPILAAEAPPNRVGHTINDSDGRPILCLVQLWACRRTCESCGHGFCQATFSDRTASFHPKHRCRDCKRAEGRASQHVPAYGNDSWEQGGWHDQPAWSWDEQWGESWNEGWNQGQWRQ